jgi:hypothetical protein
MPVQIQLRNDSASNWTAANPVLALGEFGLERNTGQFKIGNGTSTWNALPYGGIVGPTGATGAAGTNGTNGTNGAQGPQGEPGSIDNINATSPILYDVETSTLSFDGTDYVTTTDLENLDISSVVVSQTAPATPSAGDLWFNSTNLVTYIYYDSSWIEMSPAIAGTDGTDGAGVPVGGTAGQILSKVDGTDYNTVWADNSAESRFFLVRNNTGSTILKGTLVAATDAEPSGRIDVAPFEVTGLQDSELRVMGVATANITDGVNGTVMSFGTLRNIDTRGNVSSAIAVGDETWAAGDILYAHPTVDGKLTNVRPQHDLVVAFITVRHASLGQISVRITSGTHLEWLHDVNISSPSDGQLLSYDDSSGVWVNTAAPATDATPQVFLLMGA